MTSTWATRGAASVVLAGLLYALSVIYRNSRVSERRSNDIVTALLLTEGRDSESLDRIIQLLGDILGEFARGFSIGEVFVGHVGGDDFIVVLPMEMVESLAETVHTLFHASIEPFYSPEEWERGTVKIVNRQGLPICLARR